MAARAVAYSEPSCCSDGLQSSKAGKVGEEQEDRRSPAGMDYVRRSVLVEVGTLSLIAQYNMHWRSLICFCGVPDQSMWAVQSLKSVQRSYVIFALNTVFLFFYFA